MDISRDIDVDFNKMSITRLNMELDEIKREFEEKVSKIQDKKEILITEMEYAQDNYPAVSCSECVWILGRRNENCGYGVLEIKPISKLCSHYCAIGDFVSVRVKHSFTTNMDVYRIVCTHKNKWDIFVFEEDKLLKNIVFARFECIKSKLKKQGWVEDIKPNSLPFNHPSYYPTEIMVNPKVN